MSAFDFGDAVWVKEGECENCCFWSGCSVHDCLELHSKGTKGHYIRPPAPPADKPTDRPAERNIGGVPLSDWSKYSSYNALNSGTKKDNRPAAPSPDISYPMTNGELMDAISRLGNLPASSGFCSGSVEKEIEYQIKFLLEVQRKRALMLTMEARKEGGK